MYRLKRGLYPSKCKAAPNPVVTSAFLSSIAEIYSTYSPRVSPLIACVGLALHAHVVSVE